MGDGQRGCRAPGQGGDRGGQRGLPPVSSRRHLMVPASGRRPRAVQRSTAANWVQRAHQDDLPAGSGWRQRWTAVC